MSSTVRCSGSRTSFRAGAVRWICPPQGFVPSAPTMVSSLGPIFRATLPQCW
jgi:hypothetical protein